MINIAIIEDNIELRERLKKLMDQSDQLSCLIAVESVEQFFHVYTTKISLDILLLDIGLPGISGIKAIPSIKKKLPALEIVMLTVYKDADKIFNALCMGASGYLLKDINFDQLEKHLINIVEVGGAPLSPQIARRVLDYFQPKRLSFSKRPEKLTKKETQVVRFLVDGHTYQDIADRIGISLDGVRYHVKNIYKKLQVRTKTQVIKKFLNGDIEL